MAKEDNSLEGLQSRLERYQNKHREWRDELKRREADGCTDQEIKEAKSRKCFFKTLAAMAQRHINQLLVDGSASSKAVESEVSDGGQATVVQMRADAPPAVPGNPKRPPEFVRYSTGA
ncbi:MAG: hypothetical protein KC877_04655 [Candidatus Kaiserbacteria bacterium]|nr:hypothetical protein [Candidatus Kaiserbacteria bacterium]MCB9816607.1 hypothetical protein [Candidatus Nomurabacteria bacterium]